ncbi:hypothetical protein J31TS4_16140 [Paenibacillus sp. J31TS4]|nr:hypothetical protein J31TS4_16140 [Paenibacillus sp. J31TS4]
MRITDEQLDKLGEFFTSSYVAKNQPWILELTFEEWIRRHLMRGGEGVEQKEAMDSQLWESCADDRDSNK